jgi:hypothetical protein
MIRRFTLGFPKLYGFLHDHHLRSHVIFFKKVLKRGTFKGTQEDQIPVCQEAKEGNMNRKINLPFIVS